jgi:hypothetical protein
MTQVNSHTLDQAWWYIPVIPTTQEAKTGGDPGQKISKTISKTKLGAGSMTQVVEYLFSKCKALSSSSSTTKKQKTNKTPKLGMAVQTYI